MTAPAIRPAQASDVDFIATVDLSVDETDGSEHHDWGAEQHAEHRERMAWFIHDDRGLALIVEGSPSAEGDRRAALLLARFRDLHREPPALDTRMYLETLWPALPPGWAPTDGRFAEVFQLWVRPDHRRRGIASQLKMRLDEAARARGLGLVYTHTLATHDHVIALNERLGYRAFRRGPLWDHLVRVSLAKRLDTAAAEA